MSAAERPGKLTLPDHTQLPDSDGTFAKNFQEHPPDRFYRETDRAERLAAQLRALGIEPES